MTHPSRRRLLLGGGLALGAAAIGSPLAGPPARAADLDRFPDPELLVALPSLAAESTMQDVVLEPDGGALFVTQAVAGSNGSRSPSETTVVNRIRVSDGAVLDSMRLVDAGHGLGFEVTAQGDRVWIWTTWQGGGGEYDFVRLRYRPGTWRRGQAGDALDLTEVAFQDEQDGSPEAVYHFDQGSGTAVERHFHWPRGSEAPSETYSRRRIADLLSGTDATRGRITLPATPPQVQGFATLDGSLFRLVGAAGTKDRPDADDPIAIEQYSWSTGRLVARRRFPTLGMRSGGWKDGVCEPQGLSVYREPDGTASMLVGVTTGAVGRRDHQVLRFAGVSG